MSLLGGAVAGGLGLAGSLIGSKRASDAAKDAAAASQFRGVDITSGLGTTLFQGGDFTSQLSPELQALRDALLGTGATALDQFQTFDPMQAGQLFSKQLTDLAAPQEKQQRLDLENRLFQQGLTGATTGQGLTNALLQAQGTAQGQRDITGLEFGQQQQRQLFQNALGGIQAATTLDQLLQSQLAQSIAAGGARTTAATNAAQFGFDASLNQADAISGFFGNLGTSLADVLK